jgi:hypothetical protein
MNKNPCVVTPNASIVSEMPTVSGGPFPQGVTMNVTSPYGPREPIYTANGTTANFHFGVDFWRPEAPPPLVAMTDGTVTLAVSGDSIVGNCVRVQNEEYSWEYYHLSAPAAVAVGDVVTAGQYIGNVGSTGMSTGPHLHLGIHQNGSTVDPMPFLSGNVSAVSVIPEFRPSPPLFSEHGTSLVMFTGGTTVDLENLARSAGAKGVWVQDKYGKFQLLIVDGPDFMRQPFDKAFPTPFGVCAVSLVKEIPAR